MKMETYRGAGAGWCAECEEESNHGACFYFSLEGRNVTNYGLALAGATRLAAVVAATTATATAAATAEVRGAHRGDSLLAEGVGITSSLGLTLSTGLFAVVLVLLLLEAVRCLAGDVVEEAGLLVLLLDVLLLLDELLVGLAEVEVLLELFLLLGVGDRGEVLASVLSLTFAAAVLALLFVATLTVVVVEATAAVVVAVVSPAAIIAAATTALVASSAVVTTVIAALIATTTTTTAVIAAVITTLVATDTAVIAAVVTAVVVTLVSLVSTMSTTGIIALGAAGITLAAASLGIAAWLGGDDGRVRWLLLEDSQILDVGTTEDDELIELIRRRDLGFWIALAAFGAEHADVAESDGVLIGIDEVKETFVADLTLADERDLATDCVICGHWVGGRLWAGKGQ